MCRHLSLLVGQGKSQALQACKPSIGLRFLVEVTGALFSEFIWSPGSAAAVPLVRIEET